jgi:DNA-binding SARP family transcriptional activator
MTLDVLGARGRSAPECSPLVCLFNGPYVVSEGVVAPVADGTKRLLSFVVLRDGRVDRRCAARVLWPHLEEAHAAARLRTSLWRLRSSFPTLLTVDKDFIALADTVEVDVLQLSAWAERLIDGTATSADLGRPRPRLDEFELLPDWTESWVILARERIRQRLLHGVEALSCLLVAAQREAEAVDAALLAVSVDPLRESALRALVIAHLAYGNVADAQRSFDEFRARLARELGVRPSAELAALLPSPRRPHARRLVRRRH